MGLSAQNWEGNLRVEVRNSRSDYTIFTGYVKVRIDCTQSLFRNKVDSLSLCDGAQENMRENPAHSSQHERLTCLVFDDGGEGVRVERGASD